MIKFAFESLLYRYLYTHREIANNGVNSAGGGVVVVRISIARHNSNWQSAAMSNFSTISQATIAGEIVFRAQSSVRLFSRKELEKLFASVIITLTGESFSLVVFVLIEQIVTTVWLGICLRIFPIRLDQAKNVKNMSLNEIIRNKLHN